MFSNEEGDGSLSRLLTAATLGFAGWFTVRAVNGTPVPSQVWDFWQPIILTLILWAGGPRMGPYIAQAISGLIARVGRAFSSSRRVEEETVIESSIIDDDPVPDKPEVR